MYTPFEELSDESRIWIFQSASHLNMEHVEVISAQLINFISDWQAHGKDLLASFQILKNRFIVVALDEESYKATGCSIDKLTHLIQEMEQRLHISLLDRMNIAFVEDGLINSLPMSQFSKEIEKQEINENTLVFNNLIETKEQLKNEWEVPVKDSWHKQLLPVAK